MRAFPDPRPLPAAIRRIAAIRHVVAAAALLLGVWGPAIAEKADRGKPINVEADRMQYDDVKQINVFTGNVVLTKGTILLRADRLVIRQDPEGYQYGTASGNLAFFRQKREGVDQFVEGQARQIDYDGKRETFRLQQQAMMRRTEKERVIDEVHGNDILYESRNEFFTVEGAGGAAATPGNPAGRVRVVIQPREPGAAQPAGASPAAGPAAPAPLKPAEQLAPPREGAPR